MAGVKSARGQEWQKIKKDRKEKGKPAGKKAKGEPSPKRKSGAQKLLAKAGRLDAKAQRIQKQADNYRRAYEKLMTPKEDTAPAADADAEDGEDVKAAVAEKEIEDAPAPSQGFFIDNGKKEEEATDTAVVDEESKGKKEKKEKSKKMKSEDANETAPEDFIALETAAGGDGADKKEKKKKSKKSKSEATGETPEEAELAAAQRREEKRKKRKRNAQPAATETPANTAEAAGGEGGDEGDDAQPAEEAKPKKKAKKVKKADEAHTEEQLADGGAEQWNVSALEGGAARQQKFMRLLGGGKGQATTATTATISSGNKANGSSGAGVDSKQTIASVQDNLERQYETGMRRKDESGGRKRGLGA